jgi:hypothetical protein
MTTESFPIRILRDPISSRETGADGVFQGVKRSFFITHDSQRATGVIENCVVIAR